MFALLRTEALLVCAHVQKGNPLFQKTAAAMRQQQDKCSARHQLLILERRRRPLEFFSSHNAVFNSMYDIDRPYIMHVSVSAFQMERHQYKAWSNFKTEKNPCCQILAFILEPLKTVPNQSARNPQRFPGKKQPDD